MSTFLRLRGPIVHGWPLGIDGTAANPAVAFTAAPQSGIYRAGSSNVGIGGTLVVSPAGLTGAGAVQCTTCALTGTATTTTTTLATATATTSTTSTTAIANTCAFAAAPAMTMRTPAANTLDIGTGRLVTAPTGVTVSGTLSVPGVRGLSALNAMGISQIAPTSSTIPTCPVAPTLALDVTTLSLTHNANVTAWGAATGYAVGTGGTYPMYKKLSSEPGDQWVQLNGVSNVAGGYLDFGTTTWNVATNGGFTFVGYVKFTGTPTTNERLFDFRDAALNANNVIQFFRVTTTANTNTTITSAAGTVFGGTEQKCIAQERWQVVGMRLQNEGTNVWRLSQWEDGTKYAGAAQLSVTLVDRTATVSYVGRPNNAAHGYSSIAIREMLFYDDDLLDSQIAQLTAYLKAKYDTRFVSPGGIVSNIASINNFRYTNIQHWGLPGNPMRHDILNYLKASRDGCSVFPATDGCRVGGGTYPGTAGSAFYGGVLLNDGRVFCVPFNATAARIYDPVADTLTTPTGTYPGSGAFLGGVLLNDGRVFCVPWTSTAARIYDPTTDTLSTPTGTYPVDGSFGGGVLLNDGRVFCVPESSTTARIYDPVTNVLMTPPGTYPGSSAFRGGVLLPDGRVFCVPRDSTTARIYDPATDTVSTPSGTYPGSGAFLGGVLLPDGRVFCVPLNSTTARIYDPVTDTVTIPSGTYPGSGAFIGGALTPDGRVFCVPLNSTTGRIYDPVTDTVTTPSGTYPGTAAFSGGVFLPDGRIFCVPYGSTTSRLAHCGGWGAVTLPLAVLTSPFLNKL